MIDYLTKIKYIKFNFNSVIDKYCRMQFISISSSEMPKIPAELRKCRNLSSFLQSAAFN